MCALVVRLSSRSVLAISSSSQRMHQISDATGTVAAGTRNVAASATTVQPIPRNQRISAPDTPIVTPIASNATIGRP